MLQFHATATDDRLNALSTGLGVIVLPDADDFPSCCREPLARVPITRLIPCDLAGPVPRIGAGRMAPVLSAAVPEAAIDEHGDSCGTEDDVDAAPGAGDDRPVDSESEAPAVQRSPQSNLGGCIALALLLHSPVDRFCGDKFGGAHQAPKVPVSQSLREISLPDALACGVSIHRTRSPFRTCDASIALTSSGRPPRA